MVLTMSLATEFLLTHRLWSLERGHLTRTYVFVGFADAIAFINRLAALAERAQHHPDVDLRFNRVKVMLITHDRGHSVTELDTSLALQLDIAAREA